VAGLNLWIEIQALVPERILKLRIEIQITVC
jgi:hypothetical protein